VAAPAPLADREAGALSPFIPHRVRQVGGPLAARLARRGDALSAALNWLADQVVLFRHGDLVFVTFGLFASLGAFLTLAGMGVILIGQGVSIEAFVILALGASALVVLGSWILAQLLDFRLLLRKPMETLRRPVFASWGGLLMMPLVFYVFSWHSGLALLVLVDAFARAMPIGHALGRLGCLSYGCCYGRPTRRRLAITYRNPLAKAVRVGNLRNVRLHPAAFYEAVLDLGILLVVNAAALLGAPLGVPSALALVFYGLGRFAIEFVKDNDGRVVVGRLAVNHFLSLAMASLGIAVLYSILLAPEAAPLVARAPALDAVPRLLPALLPAAVVIFAGYSVHRRRVGSW
jgi:phosphatidylglycerol:prolipoprotein diacylglycerol transferase